MSMKNILVLAVLMSWGTFDLIQAEVIRGEDVPRLDVSKMVGTWYLLTTDDENEKLACSIGVITKQSDDSYTINITYSFTPEAKRNDPNIPADPVSNIYTNELQKDSSIIVSKNNEGQQRAMIMFDVDYNSYMAIYATNETAEITSGNDGLLYIVGRQKTLPDGIVDKVKQSNFYKQGVKPDFKLLTFNTSGC